MKNSKTNKFCITMPKNIHKDGTEKAKQIRKETGVKGFSFSKYLTMLVRKDLGFDG